MFTLHKWYLDVVTDEGDALIAYAARLRWRRLRRLTGRHSSRRRRRSTSRLTYFDTRAAARVTTVQGAIPRKSKEAALSSGPWLLLPCLGASIRLSVSSRLPKVRCRAL